MKKLYTFHLIILFAFHLQSQNLIPKIIKKDLVINKIDNRLDVSFDVIDTDNNDLEIKCRIFNISPEKKYEEIIPQQMDGDIGFPVQQGLNKHISIYFDLAANQSNLVIVLTALDREPMDIAALLSKVSPVSLQEQLAAIQGKRNTSDPAHYNSSRTYITNYIENHLPLKTLQVSVPPNTCINYEATKLGNNVPSNIIIMDAHYDSAPISPGADDNGSGVSGVLEAVRILADYAFKKSVRFLFFDLEELGLVGSTIYVDNQLNSRDSIKAVINYEMIGYYSDQPNSQTFPAGFNLVFPEAYNTITANNNRGDFITNVANTSSAFLKTSFQNSAASHVPGLKVISLEVPGNGSLVPDLRRSDHAKFWDKGIPAIMLTDGANFRNKNYHTAKDSMHYLNFDFMSNVVKAAIATMIDLAEIEHGTSVEIPVDLSTFTTDLNKNSFFAYYQNDHFLLKSKFNNRNALIELFDVQGNAVCNEKADLDFNSLTKFYCPDLNPGIYYITISYPDKRETQKVFVNGF
jgi:hypothetical protein